MTTEPKVWISDKRLRSGKRSYRLRWIAAGRWQSKTIGTDRKLAEREAALLQGQLEDGTWTNIRNIAWSKTRATLVGK